MDKNCYDLTQKQTFQKYILKSPLGYLVTISSPCIQ